MAVYGYVRISTKKQSIERQIRNIRAAYLEATIIEEVYTGTSLNRREWSRLRNKLKEGDTVVFDSVSRMSRTADEGVEAYFELYGKGVNQQTTEAQVIELEDGSVMINARCNWGGSRIVGVTKDLGQTWEKHPTNRTAQLKEPVCQGSLLAVDGVPGAGRVVLFSNPNTTSGRSHMTLKASTNDAGSWPEDKWLLYDARKGWGYSCLAPVDKNHVGVLYESQGALNFLKIPYKDVLNAKNAR